MLAEGRAFSGTAIYETQFDLQEMPKGSVMLDFGEVRDFARVYVNGQRVADLWALPYRCDISKYLQLGKNLLKVEVTSTWFNRLAYDFALPPQQRKTWTIWDKQDRQPPCLVPGAELRVSGLLGPVVLSY